MPDSAATPLILVVGMHRSGTSLLASILQAIGVSLPGPLIEADVHNPYGYFEHRKIVEFQEKLLIDLGRWWPSEDGLLPLPDGWIKRPCAQSFLGHISEFFSDICDKNIPCVVKDPRTSLLLPAWRLIANQINRPLLLVWGIRNPAEVVLSLCRRDQFLAGMTRERAHGLWYRHNMQILMDSAGLPTQIIDYARWFSNPQEQLRMLYRFLDRNSICLSDDQTGDPLQNIDFDLRSRNVRPDQPESSLPIFRFFYELRLASYFQDDDRFNFDYLRRDFSSC